MPDWLCQDQGAMDSESSLILDGPETPAPLFAYRALKSVLFGSCDDDEREKENIPLETHSSYITSNSPKIPLKIKSLTPQRPSPRRMLSPAKSILRTPGIPTPRRQNVSVKFKDLKHASKNLEMIAEGPATQEKGHLQNLKHPSVMLSKSQASLGEVAELAMKLQASSGPQPETYYNVEEIDAYIAATERDMKKLVRYGQRMREYAKLSQKENATLKRQVAKLKEENAMLRQRGASKLSKQETGRTAETDGLFELSPPSKQEANTAALRYLGREPKMTNQRSGRQAHDEKPVEATEKMPPERSPPTLIKSDTGGVSASLQPDILRAADRISGVGSQPVDYVRLGCRIQLPPDRAAAAKARLRVKSEERRKTLSMAKDIQEDHGSSPVEWQNLVN